MYRFYFNCHRWQPTRDQWSYANRCIPIDELKRIDQYAFQRDVKFTLIAQLLIRFLLTEVFHKKSSSFIINRTQHNRPFLCSESNFDFNISHQNQLVCIAGTFDGKIGCDTMIYSSHKYDKLRLFKNKFTLNEYNLILKDSKNFSRLWSLKESYVKWLGIGISYKLSKLNFHLQTMNFNKNSLINDTKLEIENIFIDNIRFDEQIINLKENERQIITLCLSTNNKCQSFVELNIDDLLHGCTPFDENKEDDLISWERFQMKRQTDIFL